MCHEERYLRLIIPNHMCHISQETRVNFCYAPADDFYLVNFVFVLHVLILLILSLFLVFLILALYCLCVSTLDVRLTLFNQPSLSNLHA